MTRLNGAVIDVYARVSRAGDDRQRSTEGQVEDCRDRVVDLGGTVGQVHVDHGRSAWNPRTKRLEWHSLMARLEAGDTGGVIVFDLARFSRRPIEGERLIEAADRGLWVLDSEGEYDLTTPSGRRSFRDHIAAAAYESDRLATRVKRGKKLKAAKGESNHSRRPWGFQEDGITPHETEGPELRRLVDRLLVGETVMALMDDLNKRKVLTADGHEWSHPSLRVMLQRPRNAGLATYRREVTGALKGAGTPIISAAEHAEVLAIFAARCRGRKTSETYLFSGLLHCGRCGNSLNGRPKNSGKGPTYLPDGSRRREYYCQRRRDSDRRGCNGVSAVSHEVDRHATALILAILADPRHADQVQAAAEAVAAEREELEATLARLQKTARELTERLGRDEMPLDRYDIAIAPLDRRIAELGERLKGLPAGRPSRGGQDGGASLAEWQARWAAADHEEKRMFIRRALAGRMMRLLPDEPGRRSGPRRFDPARLFVPELS